MKTTLPALAASLLVASTGFAQLSTSATATKPAATRPAQAATSTSNIVETAKGAGSFNTLVALVGNAGLAETLSGPGPFTVFAPTDDAFAKLSPDTVAFLTNPDNKAILAGILTYHVVPGTVMAADVVKLKNATTVNGQRLDIVVANGGVTIDNVKVIKTDIVCSNGVIHVIDAVVTPVDGTVVDVAAKNGNFNTLLAACKAAGLAEMLAGPGPFTVLAPTDEAFAKLPAGTLEMLLQPENKMKLVEILTYHVVPGTRAYSDQVVGMSEIPTANGLKMPVKVANGKVMLGNATVVAADVETSNGVIHVVDAVILPGQPHPAAAPTTATGKETEGK